MEVKHNKRFGRTSLTTYSIILR